MFLFLFYSYLFKYASYTTFMVKTLIVVPFPQIIFDPFIMFCVFETYFCILYDINACINIIISTCTYNKYVDIFSRIL